MPNYNSLERPKSYQVSPLVAVTSSVLILVSFFGALMPSTLSPSGADIKVSFSILAGYWESVIWLFSIFEILNVMTA